MTNYNTLSDSTLVKLLKEGDKTAYTEIYDRYNWLLHHHTFRKLNDREEARDVVQSLFVMLWANREMIDIKTNLPGYLYTCVRNIVLNVIAHKQVQAKYILSLENWYSQGSCSTDNMVRERELARVIENEIEALPPKMREVFQLSRKLHLSHKEIADNLSLSEQTVRTQVRNALRILRLKLGMLLYFLYLGDLLVIYFTSCFLVSHNIF